MRFILLALFFPLVAAGCRVQTGVSPTENVLTDCSDRDFGFVGTWMPAVDPQLPRDVGSYQMVIERGDAYNVRLHEPDGESYSGLEIHFQTAEISAEHPHAIAEIELLRDGDMISHRRLAIAAIKNDQLYLWMIDGRKIGEHLYEDGETAVIEHFAFWSTVRCKPQRLLETIRKHSDDIVGDVQVFQRVPEVGK